LFLLCLHWCILFVLVRTHCKSRHTNSIYISYAATCFNFLSVIIRWVNYISWRVLSTCRLHLQGRRWKRYVPSNHRLTFNGLHGIKFQKKELYITTAVRTSDPRSAVPYLQYLLNELIWFYMQFFRMDSPFIQYGLFISWKQKTITSRNE
jgi:hypothetical protein